MTKPYEMTTKEKEIARSTGHLPVEELVWRIICRYDNTPSREGLNQTPSRVKKAFDEMFFGYTISDQDIANMMVTFSEQNSDEMVLMRHIPFTSTCEHHMLPFTGYASIAYIPSDNKVVGLSKLPRLLNVFAKRMQIQERITVQVTSALMQHIKPKGAACLLRAEHHCMSCRGVNKSGIETITSCLLGCFKSDEGTKAEFLRLACGR